MKSKITLLIIFLFSLTCFSQDKTYDLLKNKTQTNILYDRVFALSNATKLNLKKISTNDFLQVYHEIQRADFNERLPKLETLKNEANLGFAENQIPLSILISDFETIKTSEIENKNVFLNALNKMEAKSSAGSIFETHSITVLGALLQKSKTNNVAFILKDNLIFNTTSKTISQVQVQLESSKNWKTIQNNESFNINFPNNGKHSINFKITLSTGEVINESITFDVENQNYNSNKNTDLQLAPNVVNSISSTIPYQGYSETAAFLGQGEYEVFMDTTTGVLDKPIFLLDGFDPGDTRNTSIIYNLLNYGVGQNLANDLRAQGFDVIILNFPTYTRTNTTTVIDGGVDYIQRNAMILVELINQINALKVGTEKNVVIGPSMGGLISRYALRYMEMNSLNHDTRLYISFDAPHLGANVPIGFQHLFNYLAYGPLGNTAVQPIVEGLLKSPAGREMLIDQFEGHLQSGSAFEFNTASASLLPTGCPNFRTAFQTELNTMGFPLTTRNVAIVNGAGNGAMTGMPDMVVMDHTFNISATQRAIINLRFTPLANQTNQVSRFRGQQLVFGFWFTGAESAANSKAPTFTDGLDSAPGGKFDINNLAGATAGNALLTEFFANLNILYFDFIPTLSSMAVSSSTNLYSNVNSSSTTPFVASSIPSVNENHITLNAQNTAFALNEILNPLLNVANNEILNNLWIKNPIKNSLEINTNYSIQNASIKVTDMLGKELFSTTNVSINGNLEIPVSLSNGVYLVTISNEENSVTKKIVKQ